ncbi:unnamed protein product [Hymenolepis diminuta]|uniref:Med12 domain-containing protein n=1 Tax=Hymenolepis diminuta TaxID=6216 RepID=A0A158QD68_HYMDI|nr:unnamed protein product [Hymenolepis diminuta]
MSKFPSSERSPLKGRSSGPPDVYPQKPNQLEDALTEQLVKDGYKYHRPVNDEYKLGTSFFAPSDLETAWDLFCNTLVVKDRMAPAYEPDNSHIPVRSLSGNDAIWKQITGWLSDLSGANCNRRSTIFHTNKDRILNDLVTNRFPLSHALRLINKLIIHTTAPLENLKKKQKLDPTMEWTEEILQLLDKLFDGDLSNSFMNKYDSMCKNWDYLFGLLTVLYDNDLIEHWDVLKSLASKLEHMYQHALRYIPQDTSLCSTDRPQPGRFDPFRSLKFVLPYFQRFCQRFTESELITRRVIYWACSVFTEQYRSCTLRSNRSSAPVFCKPEDYADFFVCSHHRPILLATSSMIIALTLECPSAAVWNRITLETGFRYLVGSPLDLLPCSLACLPIIPGPEATNLRRCLLETETALLERSRLAEAGWCLFPSRTITSNECTDETNASSLFFCFSSLILYLVYFFNISFFSYNFLQAEMFVRVLNELDSQDFNVCPEVDMIASLFRKFFPQELLDSPRSLTTLVTFLCKWAVSSTRTGLHRSIIVACLLDHLHSKLPYFTFQTCLLTFLDVHAPPSPNADPPGFRSLVCLFAELIDRGLFNHDAFVRTCIARGIFDSSFHPLANANNLPVPACSVNTLLSASSLNNNFSVQSEISEDNDRISVDNPDSVRSDLGGNPASAVLPQRNSCDLNHHLQFLINFPLPQDDSYAHEQNQRAQLLYGSSARAHSRARELPRKISRAIVKLFTKSAHRLDVVHGELGKRKKKDRGDPGSTPNGGIVGGGGQRGGTSKESRSLDELLDGISTRFRSLNYYDMECVISKSMPAYLGSLNGSSTTSNVDTESSPTREHIYFPALKSVFLFFDLVENSLNIICLLETVVDTIDSLLISSQSIPYPCMTSYLSQVWIRAIGILRAYQAVLMTMPNLQQRIFNCLLEQLRNKTMEKAQIKRCIIEYLRNLCHSSAYINRLTWPTLENQLQLSLSSCRIASDKCKQLVSNALRNLMICDQEGSASFVESVLDYSAQCPELAMEWLPAIAAVVNPAAHGGGLSLSGASLTSPSLSQNSNSDLLSIGLGDDLTTWDNLTLLVGNLFASHCIDSDKLLDTLINPCLALGLDQNASPIDSLSETTVRIACHMLHRFFTLDITKLTTFEACSPSLRVPESAILYSVIRRINYAPFIDTLKMLMILSNKGKALELIEDAGEDGSAAGSDDNSSDNDRDSERETDDGHGDSSLDMADGYDLADGPTKNKRKRRRVYLGPAKSKRRKGPNSSRRGGSSGILLNCRRRNRLASNIHPCTCAFLTSGQPPSDAEVKEMPLRDFAHLVLREICVTPWVREHFYRISAHLLQENVLIDKMISSNQTRFLLHIIYHPHDVKWLDLAACTDNIADAILQLISGVNIWSLHSTRMELNLLCKQISVTSSKEALDQVATRIVNGFNEHALTYLKPALSTSSFGEQLPEALPDIEVPESDNTWLLPSLVANLPNELKTHIVTKTCDILKGIKSFWRHKNDEDQERIVMQHSILLAHPVFSSILHVCMETVDPLDRLYEQLEYFVSGVKETRDRMPENLRTRHILQECLALRLSLLGICLSSANLSTDRLIGGALILAQLIGYGVTEPHSNQTLFYACLDMLHTLAHNFAAQIGPDNQQYQNLAKKVRKKLAERHFTEGIEFIRPLLFIGRTGYPFVAVTPLAGTAGAGNRGDSIGGTGKPGGSSKFASFKSSGKSSGMSASRVSNNQGSSGSISSSGPGGNNNGTPMSGGGGVKAFTRKRGYAFKSRDRFAPWEIYDVNRRPAFLAMCGAVQVPSAPSRYEDQANILLSHEHPISHRRSNEFYHTSLFPEVETPVSSSNQTATAATPSPSTSSSSIDSASKQFTLGPVPPGKRHAGGGPDAGGPTLMSAQRRMQAQQNQQQPPAAGGRMPKPEDMLYARQQQQQQMRMQAPSQQLSTKRKRSRAQLQQDEMQLFTQMYTPQTQTSSAMAAAQAVESAAAVSVTTPQGKRKRIAGAGMVGVNSGQVASAMRRSYENGPLPTNPSSQQAWSSGRVPPVSSGGSGGRMMPNQRQNLPEFVQNRTKAQQQAAQAKAAQMAAAYATGGGGGGGGMSNIEEHYSQPQVSQPSQQTDPRFRGSGSDPNYGFSEMLPPHSGNSGPFVPTSLPDFPSSMDPQMRLRRQQQQRYNQSQVVPDPPPYPGRPNQQQQPNPQTKATAGPPSQMIQMQGQSAGQHRTPTYSQFMGNNEAAPRGVASGSQLPHFSRPLYDSSGGNEYR